MSCCDDFGNCDQGRDCPVRQPAKVATARPLYRRCDVGGACFQPDAQCAAECKLAPVDNSQLSWDFVAWVIVITAVMATVSFVFGLYIERIAAALMAAAEVVTRLVVQIVAAL
jgi:hypothetical protein